MSNIAYAIRTLAKSPGFTCTVLGSLAFGIGANAAIFSIVNGTLLHPPGIKDPDRLVAPRVNYKKLALDRIGMSATDFADVRDDHQVFSKAAMADLAEFNYTGGNSPERLECATVTWQWFDVFGVHPLIGRAFEAEDDQPGANHVAVLSFSSWRRLFGGDRSVVNRTIELNTTYRIIGVMPSEFRWPSGVDLWVPIGLPLRAYSPDNRFNEEYLVVAHLAPGISYRRAGIAMQALSKRVLDQVAYARGSQWSMVLEPFTEYAAGDLKRPVLILLGAVGFVLLIVCSNIAGLMLVRGTGRVRELAIRSALGASRSTLVSEALVETSLLAVFGTALGLAAAFGLLRGLAWLARTELDAALPVRMDAHVLAFTVCVGIFSAVLFGIMPAWHVSRLGDQYDHLKAGGRADTESHHRQRLRSALVITQLALAVVLLIGAGLLIKTLENLRNARTGFDARNVMTASVALPRITYNNEYKIIAFYRGVVGTLSQEPGIASSAAANDVPFSGDDPTASFEIEGRIVPPGDPGFHGSVRTATPEYFKTLKIPLLLGRYFTNSDGKNGQRVAIIDEDLARRYWPNENPIGKRLRTGSRDAWATIVGIVGHVKQSSLAADVGRGSYYFCLYQQPDRQAFLLVRGNIPAAQLAEDIRTAVASVDPAQAVFDLKTIDERIALALGPQQLAMRLLSAFAAAALFLAALGLYGVIGYAVTRRTREMGIRAALGADRTQIFALVIGGAMRLVAAGIVTGFAAAALLSRLASSQLFEVSPFDPGTFVLTALALAAAAMAAAYFPAWRAMRVDPATALRNE